MSASLALLLLVVATEAWGAEPPAEKPQQAAQKVDRAEALEADVTQGALRIVGEDNKVIECPLEHTDVQADISGFISRVTVTQTFFNPTDEKIEAVYVFPLPNEAAVDGMTMKIGEREIVGVIKRRADARAIYEQALAAGQTAALLEQERPNIFTQSVGNIEPQQEVRIEITYVDVLKYDMGTYAFHFPMVVGPRYNPGAPTSTPRPRPGEIQDKVSPAQPDTTDVPDGSKISPPVLKPGYRTGHDISLSVRLDAGVPIQDVSSANHKVGIDRLGKSQAKVVLSPNDSLPNKDFVLRYDVVGDKPEMAVLAHTGDYHDSARLGDGYFLLMIQPKEDERLKKSPPREIVFLVDVSGSMRGAPTAKSVAAMKNMLELCRAEKDTVQVITFAGQANRLFEKPVPVTDANIKKALNFADAIKAGGGTEMLKGIKMAIDQPIDKERMRIVVMLSDGYIGNEAQIIEHIGKHAGDQIRFWAIGMGSSPNMFLIDGVARQGGGMGVRLGLEDDTVELTQNIMTRIQRAQLAKLQIDWGEHQVVETYPARLPELWAGRPVIVFGRYQGEGTASEITISGNVEGDAVEWPLLVNLPSDQSANEVLAKVWARKKIESLMHSAYYTDAPAIEEEVTALALSYKLMSQYTSFVAVDAKEVDTHSTPARPPRRMLVPVPLPDGTQYEGFFGPGAGEQSRDELLLGKALANKDALAMAPQRNQRAEQIRKNISRFRSITPRVSALPAPTAGPAPANMRFRLAQPQEKLAKAQQQMGQASGGGAYSYRRGGNRAAHRLGRLATKEADRSGRGIGLVDRLTADQPAVRYKAARDSLGEVSELSEQADDLPELTDHNDLLRAYFLDTSAALAGYGSGDVAAQALAQLESRRQMQLAAWRKAAPALETRLDLVLRDQSIADGLAQVAKAAGLSARLVEGSLDDAAALLDAGTPRIVYLDLRGVTAATALDWLLQPARLTWRLEDDRIVAGSARRIDPVSAWVYDVRALVSPTEAELEGAKTDADQVRLLTEASAGLLAAARARLVPDAAPENDAPEEKPAEKEAGEQTAGDVTWFAPGSLLVIGDSARHAKAAQWLAQLANPQAKVDKQDASLHAKTSARAEAHRGDIASDTLTRRKLAAAETLDQFGWQLMAAAANNTLDDQAFAELQAAWHNPATKLLLEDGIAPLALRSLWQIQASSRAMPESQQLKRLADHVAKLAQPAVQRAVEDLTAKSDDRDAYGRVLYAALAHGDDPKLNALITAPRGKDDPLATAAVVARVLLGDGAEDVSALRKIVETPSTGASPTLVVLTAMACQKAGGPAWEAFERNRHDLLGKNPLPGEVIVLISRLQGSPLMVAAAQ